MPSKSKKQQKFFGMIRSLQKGNKVKSASKKMKKIAKTMKPSDVKDFASTKTKNLPNKTNETLKSLIEKVLDESEYTFNKFKEINDDEKNFDQILSENVGVKFDIDEMLVFQNNQENFGGFGVTNFVLNKKSNEILAKISSGDTTKKYVFKKLPNQEMNDFFNYSVFIQMMDSENKNEKIIYALSQSFKNNDKTEKTDILSDFITRLNTQGL